MKRKLISYISLAAAFTAGEYFAYKRVKKYMDGEGRAEIKSMADASYVDGFRRGYTAGRKSQEREIHETPTASSTQKNS